jgi:hypothetical protein
MKKEEFAKELDAIYDDRLKYNTELEDRIRNLLTKVSKLLSDYLLSNGYVECEKFGHLFYFNKDKVGFRIETPDYIFLDNEYNSITIRILYDIGTKYLLYEAGALFFFKKEDPENCFKRLKKHTGKAGIARIKAYLTSKYPIEMLKTNRSDKLKNINEKAVH